MTKQTATEVMATINGFDELAIARAFGADITTLQSTPFMFLRALAFITKRREGLKDTEAKAAALGLTIGDLDELFAEEAPDADLNEDADPNE